MFSPVGAPETEIAASPTPKAVSMLNCPGREASGGAQEGLERQCDDVLGLMPARCDRYGSGTRGPSCVAPRPAVDMVGSISNVVAVDVEKPKGAPPEVAEE